MVVAPHPDDEVIGAAALIRALMRKGTTVRVVVVTDGAASHPGSERWPRRRLVAARRRESRLALRRLGIMADGVAFLSLADGRVDQTACDRALHREARRTGRLDLIAGPAAADGHPDHRAVATALRTCRHPARRLYHQVWPPATRMAGPILALPIAVTAKRSLIRVHRTQLGAIRDDPTGFAIARHELDAFARSPERHGFHR